MNIKEKQREYIFVTIANYLEVKKNADKPFWIITDSKLFDIEGCFRDSKFVEKIIIKFSDVEEKSMVIPQSMFENCDNLETIIYDKDFSKKIDIVEIGDNAFLNCSQLLFFLSGKIPIKSISPSGKIKKVGNKAFMGCSKLMIIPGLDSESDLVIGNQAFRNCFSLQSIYINSIEKNTNENNSRLVIGTYAFDGCISLTSVDFDNISIFEISDGTFRGCNNLKKIDFGIAKIYRIGKQAFNKCTSLKNLYLTLYESLCDNISLACVDDEAFSSCHSLKYVKISVININIKSEVSHQLRIGKSAFECREGVSKLEKLDIVLKCEKGIYERIIFDSCCLQACQELNAITLTYINANPEIRAFIFKSNSLAGCNSNMQIANFTISHLKQNGRVKSTPEGYGYKYENILLATDFDVYKFKEKE